MVIYRVLAASILFALCLQSGARAEMLSGKGWTYYRLGNPADVATAPSPGTVFEGGGIDVKNAYRWMCAHSAGGDFLVIRATGTDAYNPYIQRLCPGINSVSTLIITSRKGAGQAFVRKTIRHAEAIFIAGGDQSDYVRFWQSTPVNAAIDAAAHRGVPIGGTSAGNAILARFAYSALRGSMESKQALANPFDPLITIDDGFLDLSGLLADTITDDHFVTRDRMGRLVTFLARIAQDRMGHRPRAIATDEHAAFLMDADGKGRIVGSGSAYFVSSRGRPEKCKPNRPLTFKNLTVYKIKRSGRFDIRSWKGHGGTEYTVSAIDGEMRSSQSGGSLY